MPRREFSSRTCTSTRSASRTPPSGTKPRSKITPKDVNASTDLGIAYYYMNQPDKALAQFDRSLAIDPSHGKTFLNIGIVRAFAKQDLNGATDAWQKVLEVAPNTEEARAARQALDGVRAAHQNLGGTGK